VTSALLVDLDGDGRTDMIFNDHRDFCGGSRPGSRSWVLWQGADGALRAPELLAPFPALVERYAAMLARPSLAATVPPR
jgi:hypothetical protein